jgi:thiol-disulfide isomerase/thioredoxin
LPVQLIINAFIIKVCGEAISSSFGVRAMTRSVLFVLMLGLVIAAGMAPSVTANAAESVRPVRPFTQGSLARVLEARQGRPFILMLWSLECQYCPAELKMLSELKRDNPRLDVVLIATDTVGDMPQLKARAQSYGVGEIEQWVFAEDMPERLRMEIDGRWYGEVPRTYFYDRKHQREVKTGLVDKKFFEDWLTRNAVSKSGS